MNETLPPPQKLSDQLDDAFRQLYIPSCCLNNRLRRLPLATFPASDFHKGESLLNSF